MESSALLEAAAFELRGAFAREKGANNDFLVMQRSRYIHAHNVNLHYSHHPSSSSDHTNAYSIRYNSTSVFPISLND